ncbi:hemagglutination activity domain protein [Scytonema sp. HK-05]|uniref:two-partner secretion domain-containing protein n=1 Tax=Scytonema sp. HK-05 TaxID=1137095 RepID=UPI0009362393|nr:S-layer family protein [Scytonema sp. HK-05]OKH55165.1 hypothetical protein NIES2130_27225 [Scytonema sp. HK-05]BAY47724.1 hemagglutination activity domain protein [Scytonema sp. HK-05]
MRQYILRFFFISGISFCCLTTIDSTQAQETQIVPDATLPNNSSVKLEGNTRIIEGGTRAGGNLFHSFGEFSVPTGSTAFFNNATDIQNIISRVTGGSVSNIDGLIRANGAANLFLINPSGIIFGPNASLNIGGSFLASTASAVKFADGTEFSAKLPQSVPLLTISVPIGLQFGGNGASIRNRSQVTDNNGQPVGLQVQQGNTLALVGGDVSLDGGKLNALGGRVELGGVAGAGTIGLNVDGNNLRLSFPDRLARADVSLSNKAVIDVTAEGGGSIAVNARNLGISGGSSLRAGINSVGTQAGDIMLNATDRMIIANSSIFNNVGDENPQTIGNTGSIDIKAGSLSLNNADLRASTYGKGNAGGIFVYANDSVSIANSFFFSNVEVAAEGNTGGVHIKAGSLSLTDGATLSASTFGQGNAKGVFVQANNSVDIANSIFITKAEKIGTGNSGDINIQAEAVSLTDGTLLESSTYTEGRAGNVMIDARNTVYVDNSFISNDAFGSGNGGVININARVLSLTKGAELLSRTLGEGKGGNIQINASESVTISGVNPAKENLISGLISSNEGNATGQGGNISVTTGSLRVSDGAVVSARSTSAGNGGNITVNTNTLELTGGGQLLTSAFSSGNAGNITVNATDRVSISGSNPTFAVRLNQFGVRLIDNDSPNSGLFARVTGNATANAGNIEVNARSIRLDNQGTITTETKSGEGGNITLKARDIVLRNNSNITASAGTAQAGGNGGNIKIDTDVLVSAKNSDITANAFEGNGGNIRINTQGLFLSPDSDITANSERGLDGVVEINTPGIDPSSGLVNLPEAPPDDTRLAQGCQAGGTQQQNQFIITGRGGLPPSPLEMLTPDAVQVDLVTLKPERENRKNANVTSTTTATPEPIVEATGWVVNAKGEVVLIAHAPTVTPHSSWQTSPKCDAK